MKPTKKQQQTYLPGTNVTLPLKIADLAFRHLTEYTDPSVGIQLRYHDGNRIRADIYEYKDVDESPDLTIHYFDCVNEILDSEDEYRCFVKPFYHQVFQYDDHQFLVSWYLLQDQPDEEYQYSLLALTQRGDHYLKVRYSIRLPWVRHSMNTALLNDRMLDFLDELEGLL